jgi:MFS family permease
MATHVAATATETMTPRTRKALIGAWLGFYVDMFDVYLPVIALAPAAIYFQATDVSATMATIISGMVFSATLLGRPVGAAIFGHVADRVGRRKSTIIAVTGFGVMSVVLAALPGNEQVGALAIFLLIAVRFIDGVFVGGEYTSATPLALENTPRQKRGLYGAFIMTGYPLAYCSVAIITFLLLQILSADGLDSPYVQWGWRIPFLVGALIAFAFAWWFAREVEESPTWQQGEKTKAPLLELFKGDVRKDFLQVFVLMSGIWLSLYMISAALPALLADPVGLSDTTVTVVLIIAYGLLTLGYLAAGVVSQRIGRRTTMIWLGVGTITLVPFGYWLVVSQTVTGIAGIGALVLIVTLLALPIWGVVTTYINERFHTGIRASGYGMGYTLAVIIPSFYAFYQAGLESFMSLAYTPLVLLVLGGVLIWVGAAIGPETRDVDMRPSAQAVSRGGE